MPTPNLVEPLPHPMRQLRSMPIRCLYSIYLFFLHAQSDGLCPSCLSTMPVRYRRDYLCSRESLLDHIHTVTRPPCHCIRMPLAFSVLHLFGRVVSSRQACCVLAFRVRLIIQCKFVFLTCVSHLAHSARPPRPGRSPECGERSPERQQGPGPRDRDARGRPHGHTTPHTRVRGATYTWYGER